MDNKCSSHLPNPNRMNEQKWFHRTYYKMKHSAVLVCGHGWLVLVWIAEEIHSLIFDLHYFFVAFHFFLLIYISLFDKGSFVILCSSKYSNILPSPFTSSNVLAVVIKIHCSHLTQTFAECQSCKLPCLLCLHFCPQSIAFSKPILMSSNLIDFFSHGEHGTLLCFVHSRRFEKFAQAWSCGVHLVM